MQSVAMQMRKDDQAAVMSMTAPSLYGRKPSWMDEHEVGGWCFEIPNRHVLVCGSQSSHAGRD